MEKENGGFFQAGNSIWHSLRGTSKLALIAFIAIASPYIARVVAIGLVFFFTFYSAQLLIASEFGWNGYHFNPESIVPFLAKSPGDWCSAKIIYTFILHDPITLLAVCAAFSTWSLLAKIVLNNYFIFGYFIFGLIGLIAYLFTNLSLLFNVFVYNLRLTLPESVQHTLGLNSFVKMFWNPNYYYDYQNARNVFFSLIAVTLVYFLKDFSEHLQESMQMIPSGAGFVRYIFGVHKATEKK